MSTVASSDPEIAQVIENEQRRQRHQLVMIASENYTSSSVLETTGSVLTNKYSEGYPEHLLKAAIIITRPGINT